MLRKSPVGLYLRLNAWLWKRLPSRLRNSRVMRFYGTALHRLVCRRADRVQFTHTFFFRNRPELELMRRLILQKPEDSTLNIAILGCSIGAEVYSMASTIRRARPNLKVRIYAVDRSAEVLKIAKDAVYTSQICDLVQSPIFERMTDVEFDEIFEGDRREARIRSWIREGISWHLGDASDRELLHVLGPQDIVVASNFLCHMEASESEKCLRNIAGIVKGGGYIFVTGVDLDIRERVARDLRLHPVRELIEDIHEGDPSVRRDWPCAWWGLEPLNKKISDWQMRYASVFQMSEDN